MGGIIPLGPSGEVDLSKPSFDNSNQLHLHCCFPSCVPFGRSSIVHWRYDGETIIYNLPDRAIFVLLSFASMAVQDTWKEFEHFSCACFSQIAWLYQLSRFLAIIVILLTGWAWQFSYPLQPRVRSFLHHWTVCFLRYTVGFVSSRCECSHNITCQFWDIVPSSFLISLSDGSVFSAYLICCLTTLIGQPAICGGIRFHPNPLQLHVQSFLSDRSESTSATCTQTTWYLRLSQLKNQVGDGKGECTVNNPRSNHLILNTILLMIIITLSFMVYLIPSSQLQWDSISVLQYITDDLYDNHVVFSDCFSCRSHSVAHYGILLTSRCGPIFTYINERHLILITIVMASRFGEAKNPGPDHPFSMDGLLAVGTINPTSIVSKMDTLLDLGPGVWSMSETSATYRQQTIARSFFKNKSRNVVFGAPVKAHANKFNALRGVAQGVGLFSHLPSWKAIAPLPQDLELSCRILVSFTQVSPNLVLQIITLYGPTPKCMMSPLNFLDKLMRFALERSRSFQGPTIILGDFNYTLEEIPSWGLFQQCGFADAAVLDAHRRNSVPQPTCRGLTRKSFILIPPVMQDSLVHCDTLDDHLFDSHPVLRALFKIETMTFAPKRLWFPKAFDDFFHDHDKAQQLGQNLCEQHNSTIDSLIVQGHMDEAALIWTNSVEHVLQHSSVDVEGSPIVLPSGTIGRTKFSTTRNQPPSIPIPKPGRDGDFEPEGEFHSVKLRRWLRQVRRLQTMISNRAALNNCSIDRRSFVALKCNELWKSILNAKGFQDGFVSFLLDHFITVPLHCPDLPILNEIKDFMMVAYRSLEKDIFRKQNRKRMDDIRFDLAKKGGRIAYRMLKDDDKYISSVFHNRRIFHLKKQRIFHSGQRILFVDDGTDINLQLPIVYDTQCVLVDKVENNTVYLRDPIFLRSGIETFTQTEVVANDKDKAQLSADFWNTCWQRDDRSDDESIILAAQHILDCVPNWSPYPGHRASIDQFKLALTGTKKRNMRGSCKFSTIELQRIPDSLLDTLIKIFTAIENGQPWPKQWMTAFVVFLPKVDEAKAPSELRPITVISKIYRVWARMHALQIISWASQNVVPFIGGGIRDVNPQELMTYIQFAIESHSTSFQSLQGLVLDIQKAFNNLHRAILENIFRKLGIPEWIIVPYRNMMSQVARQLVFPTFVSDGILSTCGVPEGCPLAVLGMLAYTVNLHAWLFSREPDVSFYGFADNWSIYSGSISCLKSGIRDIEQFCDLMLLPLAGDKSWVWSTSAPGRKALSQIILQGKNVPIRHNEKELGCDMQYTRRPCRHVFQKRVNTAIDKLRKVPRIPVQKKFKKRLVKGSAMPSCEYGSPLIHASKQELHKLRSEVSKALGGGRAGESPYLTCLFGGKDIADPEFIFVLDKLRVIRSLASRSWFSLRKFLQWVVEPGDRPGPAKSLHNALMHMDLRITPDGEITFHHGVTINVFTSNFNFLVQMMEFEWAWVVSCRLATKRKVWKPVYFNPRQFRRFESTNTEQKIQTLLVHTNGAYYTNDQIARFKSDHNSMCPWCESHDSIRHRIHCKSLQNIRDKHLHNIDLTKIDDIFQHHAIHIIPDEVWDLMHQLSLRYLDIPRVPLFDCTPFSLYIDGSCTDPTISMARLSSGAVTLVQDKYQSCVVASQLVPGVEQSSSRGEILAGVLALSFAFKITIYTDYQLFYDRVLDMQKGCKPQSHWTNIDLWDCVHNLIKDRQEHITVVKVKAHENWEKLSGDRRMQAWHNQQVDLAAKREISSSPLFKLYQKIVNLLKQQEEQFEGYAGFLVDSALDIFKNKVSKEHYREKFDIDHLSAKGNGKPSWVCRTSFDNLVPDRNRFPHNFLEAIVEWFAKLSWGHQFVESYNCITWVELYIDFVLSTRTLAPVRLPSANSKKAGNYVNRDNELGKHLIPLLGGDVFTFASAIKYLDRKGILRLPKIAPRVSMSSMLGLAEKYAGLSLRPKLTHGTKSAIWLQKAIPHFCPARGHLNFVLNHIPATQDISTPFGNVGHSL